MFYPKYIIFVFKAINYQVIIFHHWWMWDHLHFVLRARPNQCYPISVAIVWIYLAKNGCQHRIYRFLGEVVVNLGISIFWAFGDTKCGFKCLLENVTLLKNFTQKRHVTSQKRHINHSSWNKQILSMTKFIFFYSDIIISSDKLVIKSWVAEITEKKSSLILQRCKVFLLFKILSFAGFIC